MDCIPVNTAEQSSAPPCLAEESSEKALLSPAVLSPALLVQPGSSSSSSQLTLPQIPLPYPGERSPSSRADQNRGSKREAKKRRRHPVAKVKGNWNTEEDARLVRLVDEYGEGNWSVIAKHFPGRIGKQCRERWHNQLRPDIKRDAWTEEEEHLLIRVHQELGNRWADIAKRILGRTENAVKNHWNATLRRKDNVQDKPCGVSSVLKDYMRGLNLTLGKRKRLPSREESASPVSWQRSDSEAQEDDCPWEPARLHMCNSGRATRARRSCCAMTGHFEGSGGYKHCSSPYDDAGLLSFMTSHEQKTAPPFMNRTSPSQLFSQQASAPQALTQEVFYFHTPQAKQGFVRPEANMCDAALQLDRTDVAYRDFLACRETLGHHDVRSAEADIFSQDRACMEPPCLEDELLCPSQAPMQIFDDEFASGVEAAHPRLLSPILESTVVAPASGPAAATPQAPPSAQEDCYAAQNARLQPWALRIAASLPTELEEQPRPANRRKPGMARAHSCAAISPTTAEAARAVRLPATAEAAHCRKQHISPHLGMTKVVTSTWTPVAAQLHPPAPLPSVLRACHQLIPLNGPANEQRATHAQLLGNYHRPALRHAPSPCGLF